MDKSADYQSELVTVIEHLNEHLKSMDYALLEAAALDGFERSGYNIAAWDPAVKARHVQHFVDRLHLVFCKIFEDIDPHRKLGKGTIVRSGFPLFWEQFGWLMPRSVRRRSFEPAFNDMLDDYFVLQARRQTKWGRRWLVTCYTSWTLLLFIRCLRPGGRIPA